MIQIQALPRIAYFICDQFGGGYRFFQHKVLNKGDPVSFFAGGIGQSAASKPQSKNGAVNHG